MTDLQTVYVVDDNEAICEAISAMLQAEQIAAVCFHAAPSFLDARPYQPNACVLLDVRMPGMDGLTLLESLADAGNSLPVIIMTGHADLSLAIRALRAGAVDFLEKPASGTVLLESVRRALALAAQPSPDTAVAKELEQRFATLSGREQDVLQLLIDGQPNKLIAHKLDISPRTVEVHRASLMKKVTADSLAQLIRMAVAAGKVPPLDGPRA